MSKWYSRVTADPQDYSPLIDAIAHFETELEAARLETFLKGSLEKASSRLPGITTLRFGQLQEVEAILKYLNIRFDQVKGAAFKKYLEGYARSLSSRDAEKYADADDKVIEIALLINQIALVRNQYLAIMKGLDSKNWQISNLTRLKAAGFEDYSIDDQPKF
jgi:hypothetical protein